MDFSIKQYIQLLKSLLNAGFFFQTFENYIENPIYEKCVILRHDIDRAPKNALVMAKIEKELNIKASYFFRVVDNVWNEDIIKDIASLGHEIAYHYEDLTLAKGDYEQAIIHFEKQMMRFKKIYKIKTACMHGSPMSKWDNRKLWDNYDYHNYGIIAEPYFDLDFNKVFYITDASRAWNNEKVSIRDKVNSGFNITIKSTHDIINLIESRKMPHQVMINIHPHNWSGDMFEWLRIKMWQGMKNAIKRIVILIKK